MRVKAEDYIWLHREDRQTDKTRQGQARLMIQLEIKVI